jgi:hypothetical protein
MDRVIRCVGIAGILVLVVSASASAQATAELNGRVTDETKDTQHYADAKSAVVREILSRAQSVW